MSRALLLFFALAASQAFADDNAARDTADLTRAQELRAQADADYGRIDGERKTGEAACAKKILVNHCLDQLRDSLNKRERAARALQIEAGKLERGVKARGVAAKDAEREAARPERTQQQIEQGAQYEVQQTEKRSEQAKKRADHDKAVAGGPQRAEQYLNGRAAKDAALVKKHEADAKAAAQRAQQAREDAARYAEKRRKLEEKKAAKKPAAANAPITPIP